MLLSKESSYDRNDSPCHDYEEKDIREGLRFSLHGHTGDDDHPDECHDDDGKYFVQELLLFL